MRSREYWQGRTQRRFLQAEAQIEAANPQLIKAFEKAKREIETQINAFFGRYAKNNKVSWEEAQKVLSLDELRNFKDDLATFKKLAKDSVGTFSLEVDNLSVKARITRLEALQAQTNAILERLYQSENERISDLATELYTDQYHRTLFDIDQYVGFHQEYAQIDDASLKRLINYPFDGAMFSERLWRQSADLKFQIRQTIGEMLVTGKHPRDYAKTFSARFGVKEKEAYRLLYTEGAFVTAQAHMDGYAEDEIERYMFDATLDGKTCDECGALDGKTFQIEKAVPGENAPPMHPFCRCVAVPVVEGTTFADTQRFARDKDGRSIQVPGNMTYTQWKEKFIRS